MERRHSEVCQSRLTKGSTMRIEQRHNNEKETCHQK
jgi:hypothetical protein